MGLSWAGECSPANEGHLYMPSSLRKKRWLCLLAAVALSPNCAAAAASLHEETVIFDPARTTVDFTLGDVLHTVHGTFRLKSGVIHFDPDGGKASGSVVVDAT